MRVRIALAQMRITGNQAKNLKRISYFTELARKKRADIVVFPEIAASGLSTNRRDFDISNRLRDYFARLAVENSIDMVPGSVIIPSKGKLLNTTYYIDRNGNELGRYHKRNLWLTERDTHEPGRRHTVIRTRFGKVGLLICWDMVMPELFRPMVREGAEIILCPSYWWYGPDPLASPEVIKALAVARSFECLSVLAYCNAAGRDAKGRTLLGRSQIVSPYTKNNAILDNNKEGLLVSAVDTKRIKALEKYLLIRKGLREFQA